MLLSFYFFSEVLELIFCLLRKRGSGAGVVVVVVVGGGMGVRLQSGWDVSREQTGGQSLVNGRVFII